MDTAGKPACGDAPSNAWKFHGPASVLTRLTLGPASRREENSILPRSSPSRLTRASMELT